MNFFGNEHLEISESRSRSRYDYIVEEYLSERQKEMVQLKKLIENRAYEEKVFENENFGDFDNLSDICKECIISHTAKYREILKNRNRENNFTISCKGIPKDYVKDEVLKRLDIEKNSVEAKNLISSRDIVTWAEMNCENEFGPWIARDYQVGVLRCTAKRMVTRLGRRSGKSDIIAIKALYYCINRPFTKKVAGKMAKRPSSVLIITPRQTHADNILEKIDEFFANNPLLGESYLSYKKSPYTDIKFKNGSRLVILTAGTGGANAGLSIRSFSADVLILDEANYLGAAELKAANAILASNRDCIYHVSSTPVGMQDFFWNFCFSSPRFKEFYTPTPVIPHWSEIKEDVYETVMTTDDFLHEYMAVFSASSIGVFRLDLIQKATKNYVYESMSPDRINSYTIGVDWNSNAGTEIYVTGYNREHNFFFGAESSNIPKSEWTQTRACDEIIRLLLKWRPEWIYVDRGYGEMQIETLKQYSINHGHRDPLIYNLRNILKPFDFGSKIEIRDPVNGRVEKKDAKPFLVKNTVKRFEEERMFIPASDKLLVDQLSNYAIKSLSPTGRPTYHSLKGDIGDHRLDAMMLSLAAFSIEMGDLMRTKNVVQSQFFMETPKAISRDNFGLDRVPNFSKNDLSVEDKEDSRYRIVSKDGIRVLGNRDNQSLSFGSRRLERGGGTSPIRRQNFNKESFGRR